MSLSKEAKVLSPIRRKNKNGIVFLARISRYVDGVRKSVAVGTFPTKLEAQEFAEKKVVELNSFVSEDIKETAMTLMDFIRNHYAEWRKDRFVAPNVEIFIRFLSEHNIGEIPLQKINKRWCDKYRKQIEFFRKDDGSEYNLNNLYIRLVAELSWCLRYAYDLGFIKENHNDRLQNPYIVENHPRWVDEKEHKYLLKHSWYNRAWNRRQLIEFLPKFKALPETQIVKKATRAEAQTRKANVMKSDCSDSWKVYWKDNDGKYRSKNFNWKQYNGRERAKVLADAYAKEVTKTLEQSDGHYVTERRTFSDIDTIMWYAYMTLTLMLGIRNGEACALKFEDFDESRRYVFIRKQLTFRKGKVVEEKPKKKSFRDISYPQEVQEVLDALKLYYQTNDIDTTGYLLQYRNGGAVRPDYWHKQYKKVQTLAGIPKAEQLDGTHSGRHTHLSILAQAGVPVPMLQQRAGHNDIRTTTRYYIHSDNDYLCSDTISLADIDTEQVRA